jgi:hypothetical protein
MAMAVPVAQLAAPQACQAALHLEAPQLPTAQAALQLAELVSVQQLRQRAAKPAVRVLARHHPLTSALAVAALSVRTTVIAAR